MKHVNEVLPTTIKTHTTSTQNFSTEETKKINAVFARLKLIYPGKYDLTFKTKRDVDLTKREWSRQILALSYDQLEAGFEKLKNSDVDWPDIKTLINLSKPEARAPCHAEYQLPYHRNHSKEVADQNIQKLKEIMESNE